jgi:hypothetical protein
VAPLGPGSVVRRAPNDAPARGGLAPPSRSPPIRTQPAARQQRPFLPNVAFVRESAGIDPGVAGGIHNLVWVTRSRAGRCSIRLMAYLYSMGLVVLVANMSVRI